MIKYEIGKTVNYSDGSTYLVKDIYTLTQAEMINLELCHPDRVRLHKLSGVGSDVIDCALTRS